MARKTKDAAGDGGAGNVPATVMLSIGEIKGTHRFEHLSFSMDDPKHVTVVLSSDDGKKIAVLLPRAEVKRLLTWQTIMAL